MNDQRFPLAAAGAADGPIWSKDASSLDAVDRQQALGKNSTGLRGGNEAVFSPDKLNVRPHWATWFSQLHVQRDRAFPRRFVAWPPPVWGVGSRALGLMVGIPRFQRLRVALGFVIRTALRGGPVWRLICLRSQLHSHPPGPLVETVIDPISFTRRSPGQRGAGSGGDRLAAFERGSPGKGSVISADGVAGLCAGVFPGLCFFSKCGYRRTGSCFASVQVSMVAWTRIRKMGERLAGFR